MRVVVLGAGVAGATSAYYLAARGYDVTVIEREAEAARGTTFANGGQLSYSFTDALARPSFIPTLPGLLLGRDPAIRIRPWNRPYLLPWSLRFLSQCTTRRARENTLAVLSLALRSRERLADIREQTRVQFTYAGKGKLVLLPSATDLATVRAGIRMKREHGCETELLDMPAATALEPALDGFTDQYAAAIYSAADEVGDARLFTQGILDWLVREKGVDVRYGTCAARIDSRGGRFRSVETGNDSFTGDALVVALGHESDTILRTAGLHVPIYPVRGYSMTLPRGTQAPAISITDTRRRVLWCPLGDSMRVSGFADFVGDSSALDSERQALLGAVAEAIAPQAADYAAESRAPWAGSRPMTPDGRPLTGPTRTPGIFVNCGHGMLGWTLAAATGDDVAAAVDAQLRQP